MAEARRLLIWLDPGHGTLKRDGARDTGAADTSGLGTRLCEKDLVLAAAQRARDLLTAQGHEARLTHQRADYSEVMSYSDRGALAAAVDRAAAEADVFLTEIKAAAIDVVAEGAAAAGRALVFCDNEPRLVPVDGTDAVAPGGLDALLTALAASARARFEERRRG